MQDYVAYYLMGSALFALSFLAIFYMGGRAPKGIFSLIVAVLASAAMGFAWPLALPLCVYGIIKGRPTFVDEDDAQ